MSEFVMAWHWLRKSKKGNLLLRNGRKAPAIGVPLEYKGRVKMCESGLHASRRAIDALGYIPDEATVLCRVRCKDVVAEGDNKLVCRKRTIVQTFNCEKLLHEFACRCAERALTRAKVTDERSWNAIKVKRAWLKGEATDAELASARAAAWPAAWDAARAAARAAAWAAAWDAAWDAAGDAARAAAGGTAAWHAEMDWQNDELLKMLGEEGWDGE